MEDRKPSRFELRLPPSLGDEIDQWRRAQSDIPARAEAARRLIELGLKAALGAGQGTTFRLRAETAAGQQPHRYFATIWPEGNEPATFEISPEFAAQLGAANY